MLGYRSLTPTVSPLYNSWRETVSLCLVLSSTQNREMQAENSLPRPGGPLPLCPEPLLVFLESLSASLMLLHFTMVVYLTVYLHQRTVTSSLVSITSLAERRDWINLSDEQMMNERGFLVWHASFGLGSASPQWSYAVLQVGAHFRRMSLKTLSLKSWVFLPAKPQMTTCSVPSYQNCSLTGKMEEETKGGILGP